MRSQPPQPTACFPVPFRTRRHFNYPKLKKRGTPISLRYSYPLFRWEVPSSVAPRVPAESNEVTQTGTPPKTLSGRPELGGRRAREAPRRKQSVPVGVYMCVRAWSVRAGAFVLWKTTGLPPWRRGHLPYRPPHPREASAPRVSSPVTVQGLRPGCGEGDAGHRGLRGAEAGWAESWQRPPAVRAVWAARTQTLPRLGFRGGDHPCHRTPLRGSPDPQAKEHADPGKPLTRLALPPLESPSRTPLCIMRDPVT